MTPMQTARELITYAEYQFSNAELYYGHGSDSAESDAFYLVMATLGLDFNCDEDELDAPILEQQILEVASLIKKRIQARIPVAYLVKQAWFAGFSFYVDERVLIPRSPIAELITSKFSPWIDADNVSRILDLGTGSGCIPIACAYAFPSASVDAVDVDKDALVVATINVEQHQLSSTVALIHSDLFQQLSGKQYDIIISNPPYVSDDEMHTLPTEYQHEPQQALRAQKNGLAIVARILQQAHEYLNNQGILIVEVGNSMGALIAAYPDVPFTWLEFEYGGEGVFLLHKNELAEFSAVLTETNTDI